jgi:hypothetical protein
MPYLPICAALSVLIVLVLVNEIGFHGTLFPSETVGGIGGLGVLAAVFAVRAGAVYRGQWPQAARHFAIWLVIIAIVMGAYWLFG